MTPDNSEGGPRHRDRPTAANAATKRVPGQSPTPRAGSVLNIYAKPFVVSGHDRTRQKLVVRLCPRCGMTHLHRAPVEFVAGIERAPCHARYVLVAVPLPVAT